MSFNRENVVWQSRDGWYLGFFSCWVTGDDPEWDVDYDFSSFEWASGPHRSREEALASWCGANPGGHYEEMEHTEKCDEMFRAYSEARAAKLRAYSEARAAKIRT